MASDLICFMTSGIKETVRREQEKICANYCIVIVLKLLSALNGFKLDDFISWQDFSFTYFILFILFIHISEVMMITNRVKCRGEDPNAAEIIDNVACNPLLFTFLYESKQKMNSKPTKSDGNIQISKKKTKHE